MFNVELIFKLIYHTCKCSFSNEGTHNVLKSSQQCCEILRTLCEPLPERSFTSFLLGVYTVCTYIDVLCVSVILLKWDNMYINKHVFCIIKINDTVQMLNYKLNEFSDRDLLCFNSEVLRLMTYLYSLGVHTFIWVTWSGDAPFLHFIICI